MALRRPRRALAVAGAAALLSTSLLSGCGFGQATDRPYTPAWGANDQSSGMYVMNAVVVASEDGTGVFVATLSNQSKTEPVALSEISSAESGLTAELTEPIEVPARGSVNLGDDHGIPVTGDFVVQESPYLPITLHFDGAQSVDIEVPVVPATGDFADFAGGDHEGGESSGSASDGASDNETESSQG